MSSPAWSVMILSSGRITVIGFTLFAFYFKRQNGAMDNTVLASLLRERSGVVPCLFEPAYGWLGPTGAYFADRFVASVQCLNRYREEASNPAISATMKIGLWAPIWDIPNHERRMALISLYTTAPSLTQANAVLDTHINILPFSPDLIRANCASQQLSPAHHPPTAPIVSSEEIESNDFADALAARAAKVAEYLAAGKVVVVKNGSKAWSAPSNASLAKEIHIIIVNSRWNSAKTPRDTNDRAISSDMLESWPSRFVVDATAKTVTETQDVLRSIIREHISLRLTGLSGDMMFKPYLHRQRLRLVVALGGLSECGKSSMGGYIDTQFGQQGRREKFGYLFDNATKQLGFNIYTLPETVQAHILIQQIEDYSKAHFWVSILSFESLHRFASIREAKRILGPLLQIVYVDVSEPERISRQISRVGETQVEAKIKELKDKDVVKRERGAERVKDIADFILDNHGSFTETSAVLKQYMEAKLKAS
ncbi:hypothetical protein DFH06DRAFT_1134561 [Mycena polygramma]|nr:hypothetical protein DFH06DRAFT_1134561 [Mycena polygramma]